MTGVQTCALPILEKAIEKIENDDSLYLHGIYYTKDFDTNRLNRYENIDKNCIANMKKILKAYLENAEMTERTQNIDPKVLNDIQNFIK